MAKFVDDARNDGEVFTPTYKELGHLTRLLIDLRMHAREVDTLADRVEQLIEDGALARKDTDRRGED